MNPEFQWQIEVKIVNNVEWFCNLIGIKLSLYQKIIVKINCGKHITRMKKNLEEWRRLCRRF